MRRLAITNRTSLADFPGWTEECYVEWMPVTYRDSLSLRELRDVDDEAKAFSAIFDLTKKHIVGGRVMVVDENGATVLDNYQPEDLDELPPEMVNKIFADITGAQFDDPKASSPDRPPKSEPTTSAGSSVTS